MAITTNVDGNITQIDRLPDVCPLCHHAVAPKMLSGVFAAPGSGGTRIHMAFQCTLAACRRMFVGTYEASRNSGTHVLKRTAPRMPKPPDVPQEVAAVSPQFVTVLTQAAAAEDYDLPEVAGVGYRKALEFLVKDFCVSEHPAEDEAIKAMFLGQVIDRYVDSVNIKNCAKRAVWLGNDETHYVRRWEEKDMADLKILIRLTMGWIQDHLLTRKYLTDMK